MEHSSECHRRLAPLSRRYLRFEFFNFRLDPLHLGAGRMLLAVLMRSAPVLLLLLLLVSLLVLLAPLLAPPLLAV